MHSGDNMGEIHIIWRPVELALDRPEHAHIIVNICTRLEIPYPEAYDYVKSAIARLNEEIRKAQMKGRKADVVKLSMQRLTWDKARIALLEVGDE